LYSNVWWPPGVYWPSATHCTPAHFNLACFLDGNVGRLGAGRDGMGNGKPVGKRDPSTSNGKRDASTTAKTNRHASRNTKRGTTKSSPLPHDNAASERVVVLAGKWPAGDGSYEGLYEAWPLGLVQQVVRIRPPDPNSHSTTSSTSTAQMQPTPKNKQSTPRGSVAGEGVAGEGQGFVWWVSDSVRALPPSHYIAHLRHLSLATPPPHRTLAGVAWSLAANAWALALLPPPPSTTKQCKQVESRVVGARQDTVPAPHDAHTTHTRQHAHTTVPAAQDQDQAQDAAPDARQVGAPDASCSTHALDSRQGGRGTVEGLSEVAVEALSLSAKSCNLDHWDRAAIDLQVEKAKERERRSAFDLSYFTFRTLSCHLTSPSPSLSLPLPPSLSLHPSLSLPLSSSLFPPYLSRALSLFLA